MILLVRVIINNINMLYNKCNNFQANLIVFKLFFYQASSRFHANNDFVAKVTIS